MHKLTTVHEAVHSTVLYTIKVKVNRYRYFEHLNTDKYYLKLKVIIRYLKF